MMIEYIEFLGLPMQIALMLVAAFLVMQIIGELLEVKGRIVPEAMKIRKFFQRKKQEREKLRQLPQLIDDFNRILKDFNAHYSADNIAHRNSWIAGVDQHFAQNDAQFRELSKKLDQNNHDTLMILIESKRSAIIGFAERAIDPSNPITREQFNRAFKLHHEYEAILKKHKMDNGETDVAIRIINDAYAERMRLHSFVEDQLGYEI